MLASFALSDAQHAQSSLAQVKRPFSRSLADNPELDLWVRIDVGGTVTLFTDAVFLSL
jgi:hypothetical protein